MSLVDFGPRIAGKPTQNTGTPALRNAVTVASMRLA
jgi:hypothetical protein